MSRQNDRRGFVERAAAAFFLCASLLGLVAVPYMGGQMLPALGG